MASRLGVLAACGSMGGLEYVCQPGCGLTFDHCAVNMDLGFPDNIKELGVGGLPPRIRAEGTQLQDPIAVPESRNEGAGTCSAS